MAIADDRTDELHSHAARSPTPTTTTMSTPETTAPRAKPSQRAAHGVALIVCVAVALGLVHPILRNPSHTVLGSVLNDNVVCVWNFWWPQMAIERADYTLLWTPLQFAPIGTSLLLHAGTPLQTTLTAALFPHASPVLAYNVWIVLTLALNGLCAYALAYRYTRQPSAALVAAIVFEAAPFLVIRTLGHFNVLSAWGLPLAALAAEAFAARPTMARGATVGAAIALLAYVDYYYAIFGVFLVLLLIASSRWRVEVTRRPLTRPRAIALRVAIACTLAAIALALAIAVTGGTELRLLGARVSMRSTFNLRQIGWGLALISAAIWLAPRFSIRRASAPASAPETAARMPISSFAAMAATIVVLVAPLLVGGAELSASGDYVSQRFLQRSQPRGVDLASLVLGNPTGFLIGKPIDALLLRLRIDTIESLAWLGIVPIALVCLAALRLRDRRDVRRWLGVLATFGIWSLGPYLYIGGLNTAAILPQAVQRFVPLVNNARLPGRAFTLVVLATALLAAFALAYHARLAGRRGLAWLALALVLVDFWPRPYEVATLDRPDLYAALASQPSGRVLELPLGIRDGFGERGRLDHANLYYQTMHAHPMTGGFVSRLSARTRARYEHDAILRPLLDLSEGNAAPQEADAEKALASPNMSLACGARYLVVARGVERALVAFARSVFVLRPVMETDARSLYEVTGFHAPYCGAR